MPTNHYQSQLSDSFKEALARRTRSSSHKNPDVVCGGRSWRIGDFALTAWSPFLASVIERSSPAEQKKEECNSSLANKVFRAVEPTVDFFSAGKEDEEECSFSLANEDFRAVESMMDFFHNLTYNVYGDENPFLLHAKVFNLADKYQVPDLKSHALNRCDGEETSCIRCAQYLLEAIPEAYSAAPTDDKMRHALRKLWCTDANDGTAPYMAASKDDLNHMMYQVPEFGHDIMIYMGARSSYDSIMDKHGAGIDVFRVINHVQVSLSCKRGIILVADVAEELALSRKDVLKATKFIDWPHKGTYFVPIDLDGHTKGFASYFSKHPPRTPRIER